MPFRGKGNTVVRCANTVKAAKRGAEERNMALIRSQQGGVEDAGRGTSFIHPSVAPQTRLSRFLEPSESRQTYRHI